MQLSHFDYHLPNELIAQQPIEPRDTSRLLVLDKANGKVKHKIFNQIIDYFNAGDVLVLNSTRVIPARLIGTKMETGAKVEIFLLTALGNDRWEVLARPAKRLPVGAKVDFGANFSCTIQEDIGEGKKHVHFEYKGEFNALLDKHGQMPLPPYIKTELSNKERYQTVYAKTQGSVAAPTAGLHFTPELLEQLRAKGVIITEVLLHVGIGTFRPVTSENIQEHKMHSEYYSISQNAADIVSTAKKEGQRVWAVGTTSIRTLEAAAKQGELVAGDGWTDIFIYPGYNFKIVDGIVTNFHLPKSTLVMLVSAFAGRENTIQAYQEAVKEKYRFFSFGDAMLVV